MYFLNPVKLRDIYDITSTKIMNKENLFTKSGIPSKKAKVNYFTGKIAAKDISAKIKPSTEKIYHVNIQKWSKN